MADLFDIMSRGARNRSIQVFFAVVLGLTALGFFVGIGQTSREIADLTSFTSGESERDHEGMKARGYIELLENPFSRNQGWADSIEKLARKTTPDMFDPVEDPEANKVDALAFRATRRAYAGAPPTIPHPIKESGDFSCLACHRDGVTINGRLAPAMSHDEKSQCTQCHVVSQPPVPGVRNDSYLLSTENSFVGMPEPHDGEKAWPGAPATIPHSTHMRTNCMSCHGLNGRQGLRSSHPWRQNCMQCHTPDADLEAHPLGPTPFQP